ncbi:hypothetical protein LN650_01800 [Klebsiella pneumoniae subsp. pneumoniae]|nr:hypothetical protein [Klebsiella pneumoniae subsp. pneumoniae]
MALILHAAEGLGQTWLMMALPPSLLLMLQAAHPGVSPETHATPSVPAAIGCNDRHRSLF